MLSFFSVLTSCEIQICYRKLSLLKNLTTSLRHSLRKMNLYGNNKQINCFWTLSPTKSRCDASCRFLIVLVIMETQFFNIIFSSFVLENFCSFSAAHYAYWWHFFSLTIFHILLTWNIFPNRHNVHFYFKLKKFPDELSKICSILWEKSEFQVGSLQHSLTIADYQSFRISWSCAVPVFWWTSTVLPFLGTV